LGLALSRVFPPLPWTRFHEPSSHALPAAAIALTAATRRLRVSIGIGLARSCNPASRTGPNSPPEVPAPSKSQSFKPTTTRVMNSPRGSPAITRRLSRSLGRPSRLCRSQLGLDCGAWPKQPSCLGKKARPCALQRSPVRPLEPASLPPPELPLLEFAARPECDTCCVRPNRLSHPTSPLNPFPGLVVFRSRPLPGTLAQSR
jgi:hypothetical protein